MSKGIDVSLDDLIQKTRNQGGYGYKKYVKPKLNEYGDKNYSNYSQFNRNRQNFSKTRIVLNRRHYQNKQNNNNYEKRIEGKYNDKNDYSEQNKRKSIEETHRKTDHSDDDEHDNNSNQVRRKLPERRKTTENERRSSSSEIQHSKTRLKISNLHKGITNSELFQLFSEIGKLKRCGIHWDILGQSLGIADIEYINPLHAKKAIEDYNNAEVEGLEMKIEYAETKHSRVDLNERIKKIRLMGKDTNSNKH